MFLEPYRDGEASQAQTGQERASLSAEERDEATNNCRTLKQIIFHHLLYPIPNCMTAQRVCNRCPFKRLSRNLVPKNFGSRFFSSVQLRGPVLWQFLPWPWLFIYQIDGTCGYFLEVKYTIAKCNNVCQYRFIMHCYEQPFHRIITYQHLDLIAIFRQYPGWHLACCRVPIVKSSESLRAYNRLAWFPRSF